MKRFSQFCLLLLVFCMATACNKAKVQSGTVAAADGTEIRYESKGQGKPALVFIHCWSCNRHYWDGQVEKFAKDHQVVTLDLGGHGESGKGRAAWTVDGLVQDVTAVLDHLKIQEAILVGHSMGGSVSLAVAAARPDLVSSIVCVDTLQNAEALPPTEMLEQVATRMESEFPKVLQELLPSFFPENADPKVVAWTVDQAAKTDPKVAAGLIRDMAHSDLKSRMAAAKVPIRCINSTRAVMGLSTQPEINRKYADFEVLEMNGVGHFIQLEKPAEFNQALHQVLTQLETQAN